MKTWKLALIMGVTLCVGRAAAVPADPLPPPDSMSPWPPSSGCVPPPSDPPPKSDDPKPGDPKPDGNSK